MKQLLMTAPLAFALALAAGTATAAGSGSGTINFQGAIKAGTCSVEVEQPGSEAGKPIYLGQAMAVDFGSVGTEVNTQSFSLRVDPSAGCTIEAGVAKVNFASQDGAHAVDSKLHGLRAGSAQGIGIAIRDKRTNTVIAHGADSADFTVVPGQPVLMEFSAGYMSAVASNAITAGDAYADVNFTVTLP
jgi:type 1 fimbria pilin